MFHIDIAGTEYPSFFCERISNVNSKGTKHRFHEVSQFLARLN
jgi:hypothetical protein